MQKTEKTFFIIFSLFKRFFSIPLLLSILRWPQSRRYLRVRTFVSNIFLSFLTTEEADFYLFLNSFLSLSLLSFRTVEICNKATAAAAAAAVFVVVKCLQMKNVLHLFVWERITSSPSLLGLLTIWVRKISEGGGNFLYFSSKISKIVSLLSRVLTSCGRKQKLVDLFLPNVRLFVELTFRSYENYYSISSYYKT